MEEIEKIKKSKRLDEAMANSIGLLVGMKDEEMKRIDQADAIERTKREANPIIIRILKSRGYI